MEDEQFYDDADDAIPRVGVDVGPALLGHGQRSRQRQQVVVSRPSLSSHHHLTRGSIVS